MGWQLHTILKTVVNDTKKVYNFYQINDSFFEIRYDKIQK